MEINKKILASVFIIGILALALGWGTYSYFSDEETSTDNTFSAGTLDLKLSNDGATWEDGVMDTWDSPSGWAPGEYFEHALYMKNVGTTGAKHIAVKGESLSGGLADAVLLTKIAYTEDYPNPLTEYDVTSWFLPHIDADGDGKVTLTEFVTWAYSMKFWTGKWGEAGVHLLPEGANYQYIILGFTFDPDAGDEYQGVTATFDLKVTAYQSWEQAPPVEIGDGCYGYGN